MVLWLLLAWGCNPEPEGFVDLQAVDGFAGMVAVDEPHAALIARDLLSNGANAADAAVASFFTMTVTMPSRVGLLGGGVCLVYSNERRTAEVFEFLPRAGTQGAALPRTVRALAILHARHGRVRWGPLIEPAERLARQGHVVSEAFARDLARSAEVIRRDPLMSRLFVTKSGALPRQGDYLSQIEVSTVISGVRTQGAAYFHAGAFPALLAAAAAESGHVMTIEELRAALPLTSEANALAIGDRRLYFSLPIGADGAVAATMWRLLNDIRAYPTLPPEQRPGIFVEAADLAYAEVRRWQRAGGSDPFGEGEVAGLLNRERLQTLLQTRSAPVIGPTNGAARLEPWRAPPSDGASFVIADRWGDAVACGTTMNGLFGAGRAVGGMGLVLPGRPTTAATRNFMPSIALLADPRDGDTHLAVAAAGGSPAVNALVRVLLAHIGDGQPLDAAVAAPRLHFSATERAVFFEPGTAPSAVGLLRARGYRVVEAAELGRVNALQCPDGVADSDDGCSVASDPRGRGVTIRAQ